MGDELVKVLGGAGGGGAVVAFASVLVAWIRSRRQSEVAREQSVVALAPKLLDLLEAERTRRESERRADREACEAQLRGAEERFDLALARSQEECDERLEATRADLRRDLAVVADRASRTLPADSTGRIELQEVARRSRHPGAYRIGRLVDRDRVTPVEGYDDEDEP